MLLERTDSVTGVGLRKAVLWVWLYVSLTVLAWEMCTPSNARSKTTEAASTLSFELQTCSSDVSISTMWLDVRSTGRLVTLRQAQPWLLETVVGGRKWETGGGFALRNPNVEIGRLLWMVLGDCVGDVQLNEKENDVSRSDCEENALRGTNDRWETHVLDLAVKDSRAYIQTEWENIADCNRSIQFFINICLFMSLEERAS